MSYKIFTDIGADLSIEYTQAHDIGFLPFPLAINGNEINGTIEPNDPLFVEQHAFFEMLRRGDPVKTAQLNPEVVKERFRPVLESGRDIIYIALGTGLTGAFNAARLALEYLMPEFPDRRVVLFDTLSASLGEGLMVMIAAQKQAEGMELDALVEYLEGIRLGIQHWVSVDDLSHLRRGGRISGANAVIGTMLSIKPIITVNKEGKLVSFDKVRGRRHSLKYLVDMMEKNVKRPIEHPVTISHADVLEDAEFVASMVREKFGVEPHIGCMYHNIGAHVGPGSVALFFVSDKERPEA